MKLPIMILENANVYLVILKQLLMESAHRDAKPMRNIMEISVSANLDAVTSKINVQFVPLMLHQIPLDPHVFVLPLTSFSTKLHINVNRVLFSQPTMMMIRNVFVILVMS